MKLTRRRWSPRALTCRASTRMTGWGLRVAARGGRWMAGRLVRAGSHALLPRWLRVEA